MRQSETCGRDNFQKSMWIELIGFDVRRKDYGVGALFRQAGFIPDSVFLLLWNADFIHHYQSGPEENKAVFLRDDCCAYYGRPLSELHPRQRWRNGDLKRLIQCLHEYNVAVYLSVFDQQMVESVAKRYHMPNLPLQWVEKHPEVKFTLRDGQIAASLCPWKRLADGSFYEDFLLQQLLQLLPDFGFDGWHAADGFGHPRYPIYQGDFSDDMVEQSGCGGDCPVRCDGIPDELKRRAEYIWKNRRLAWIEFHCRRRTAFFLKLVSGLREIGRKVVVNSCWTREPFEAKYRYGVDNAALSAAGFAGWVIEAPASVIEIEGWRKDECDSLYKFLSSLGRIRASLPAQRLLLLNTIKDTMEQYNCIRHAPMLLEAELSSFGSICFHQNGTSHPALDGIVSCLSDGLSKSEWSWLLQRWNSSFNTKRLGWNQGIRVICDQEALESELRSYSCQPFCSSYHWHWLLLGAGAPLLECVDLSQAATAPGPFLLIHPVFYPQEKLRLFLKERGGDVIFCGMKKLPSRKVTIKEAPVFPPDSWLDSLPEPGPRRAAVQKLVRQLTEKSAAPWILSGQAHVWQQNTSTGALLFVRNDLHVYQRVRVAVPGNMRKLQAVSEYLLPIDIEKEASGGSRFSVKLPPQGMVLLTFPRD